MRILLACAFVVLSGQTALCDVVKYESSTGNGNDFPAPSILTDQFIASRFTFSSWTRVTGIGGAFASGNSIFGAIVAMSGPLPQGTPFNGSEVLLSTVFTPTTVGDHITPVSINLPAGDYSLIYGAGLFGSTGSGSMDQGGTNTPEGVGSYFFWSGGTGTWNNGFPNNTRFFVLGVPEPSSAVLFGCLAAVALLRQRRK